MGGARPGAGRRSARRRRAGREGPVVEVDVLEEEEIYVAVEETPVVPVLVPARVNHSDAQAAGNGSRRATATRSRGRATEPAAAKPRTTPVHKERGGQRQRARTRPGSAVKEPQR